MRRALETFLNDYSMVLVLLLLCALFCVKTMKDQHPTDRAAAAALAERIAQEHGTGLRVLVVGRESAKEAQFAEALRLELVARDISPIDVIQGPPAEIRLALERYGATQPAVQVIACSRLTSQLPFLGTMTQTLPGLRGTTVSTPRSYRWPDFLKRDNLRNIPDQVAVIAMIAIGMTLVIITGGIDLSVGSLIALSAVVATLLIDSSWGGSRAATPLTMTIACFGGIAVCGLVGLFTGLNVIAGIPPFIVTLGIMLAASGTAYWLTDSQSVYAIPDSFVWLSRSADVFNIPNAVFLMLLLYAVAHVVMTRTTLGRYIYAVGGNREAARLSGVPVRRVLLIVYSVSGLLAGLGGVVMASQLKSGSPTYGLMYELYVIAAVVVGGTSLMGGEGKVLGTLIGALIIAVIQNGMNLMGIESHPQKVVFGLVILAAVHVDRLKKRGHLRFSAFASARAAAQADSSDSTRRQGDAKESLDIGSDQV